MENVVVNHDTKLHGLVNYSVRLGNAASAKPSPLSASGAPDPVAASISADEFPSWVYLDLRRTRGRSAGDTPRHAAGCKSGSLVGDNALGTVASETRVKLVAAVSGWRRLLAAQAAILGNLPRLVRLLLLRQTRDGDLAMRPGNKLGQFWPVERTSRGRGSSRGVSSGTTPGLGIINIL